MKNDRENEILKDIEKHTKALTKKQDKLEKEIAEIKELEDANYDGKRKALAELRKQLADAEKPWDEKAEELSGKRDKLDDKRRKAELRLNNIEYEVRGRYADLENKFTSAKAFKGWMMNLGVNLKHVDMIKKPLKNGIQLFRHYYNWHSHHNDEDVSSSESEKVAYFAVKNLKIVGYHWTRKAQHIGDYSTHKAWLNTKFYRNIDQLQAPDEHPDGGRRSFYSSGLLFKEWKTMVEELTTFVEVDLDDESTRKNIENIW